MQQLATCRRYPTYDSSQLLDVLLDEVMLYEATYDRKLEIFYQALSVRIKQKYEEKKEVEASPNNLKSVTTHSYNVTELTLQHDAVDGNEMNNKLNRNAKVFHPRVDHTKLCPIHEEEEDSDADAEVVDDGLFDQLETMKEDILKDAENEKKNAKKLADELNRDTPSLSPSSSSSISPIFTAITQSPSPSSSPSSSSVSPISPNLSNPSSPIPNLQYDQTTSTNQFDHFDVVSQHGNDIGAQHNNINDNNNHKNVYFVPKCTNHAKGNCYISKQMVSRMIVECIEVFNTDRVNDEKLAFGYYKESVAMQINDGQINDIIMTNRGLIIIINIDLHFKDGEIMYLVANENDPEYRHKVRWCIIDFMRAHDIYNEYGVSSDQLPLSSRNTNHFQRAINKPPTNVPSKIIKYTNFKDLPQKISKRKTDGFRPRRTRINHNDLKYYCFKNWNKSPMIPVVVIKGKKQCVEWKKFIQIYDDGYNGYNNSKELWIGISMRYYSSNKQWKIECIDFDAGRVFYQHRLVGNTKYNISYNQLCKFITTTLDIY